MSGPLGSSQWMYASGAEVTQQSVKFNDDESQYLSWTPASAGNRKTWTWSGWVKRGNGTRGGLFGSNASSGGVGFGFGDVGGTNWQMFYLTAYAVGTQTTSAYFRDFSAWYHIVLAFDTTQATASNRVRLYVNGTEITFGSSVITQNSDYNVNGTSEHYLGNLQNDALFDGYLSDVHFIDGQALDPTSFGQFTNGYWEKKDYAGTYGTNGFHLTFEDDVVSEGFNTVTYTGNGGTQSISGLGLEPDFVWAKRRDGAASHVLYDIVRGAGTELNSNNTAADVTGVAGVTAFDGDGFTLGNNGNINDSNETYVAWCWDAGTGSAASNTDGSITSTVKANPDYGFSIVSYVGTGSAATVGHGLSSSAPDMIIVKSRDDAFNWGVYHSGLTSADYALQLNTTIAQSNTWDYWNDTAPTSSVFSVGTELGSNKSGSDYIAYCFAEVAGYSSIGSYTGNGSTSGPTVTTGFRPSMVIIKRTDVSNNWIIQDTTRDPANPVDAHLYLNLSNAEDTGKGFDVSDTGFQIKFNGDGWNASGGTYIYMAFADTREAAFWKDVSGQGNHWTPNNLDYRDSLPDSPANNFCVMNPLDNDSMTLSEGNLQGISPANAHNGVGCTLGVTGGKWYWEVRSAGTGTNIFFGMAKSTFQFISQYTIDAYFFSDIWGVATDGQKFGNGSGESSYGSTLSEGDILQLAFDLDNGKFYAGKNGTYYASGDPAAGSNPAFTDVPTDESMQPFYGSSTTGVSHTLNFGQDSTFAGATTAGGNTDANGIGDFAYAPPSGFLSLCSANLPTSTIIDGSEHFNTVLYTGNGSTQSITGVGFQPDWTWIKMRSGADNNILQDAVRGVGKGLFSDLTNAENASMGGMTSFDSDGFTFDGSVTSLNGSGDSFVAWNWKAGGTAVSNTDGSVTSQVSANTDAGFSIVSYTGTGANATVGHGLSSAPEMLIIKERNATSQWVVGHHNLAASDPFHKGLYLDDTRAVYDDASNFNDTAPTSTVFSVGTGGYVNDSSNTYICYAFHSVDGFSKVGSYTGNGSTDGPFVYTGFRPAWVMFKNTNNSSGWSIIDSTRNPFNEAENYLYPSASDAEYGGAGNDGYDFVSNGFKVSNTYTGQNGSGNTIIYLAFAESPFKYANAR